MKMKLDSFMARTSVEDPLKSFRFVIEVDGFARAGFKACSGLERETETTEYREGGDNETAKKSAGLTKHSVITLKRGQIMDEGQNDFYNWAQDVHDVASQGGSQRDYRRNVEIVQYERGGLVVIRWRVHEAWVKKFKAMGDLDSLTSEDSIEELTLEHEGFEKVAV